MGSAYYHCAKCGEPVKVSRGNTRQSESYAAWCEKEKRLCKNCERAEFQAQYEATVAAAEADPRNATLPKLTGTEKQVAWAQALRLDALPRLDAARDSALQMIARSKYGSAAARQEMSDAVHLIVQELRDRTDARDWIDGRDTDYELEIERQMRRRGPALCPVAAAEVAARKQGEGATNG